MSGTSVEGTSPAQAPKLTLKGAIEAGTDAAKSMIGELGPTLPFGGAAAAALMAQLIGLVDGAYANRANLESLRDRSADVLDAIVARKEDLLSKDAYKGIIARFDDVLQEVVSYAEGYATRCWLVRVLTSTADGAHYGELQQHLRELVVEAHFGIAVATDAMSGEAGEMMQRLEASQPPYMDHGAKLRQLISDAGGTEAVLGDELAMNRIMEELGSVEKITLAFVKQTISSFQADQDEGVHQLIDQPALRVFWRKLFQHKWHVSWESFWNVFPAQLHQANVTENEVLQIEEILRSTEARLAFQASLERSKPGHVSVSELQLSFPAEVQLVDRIKQLAGGAQAAGCDIPPLDPVYCGRARVAAELASSLASGLFDHQPVTALCIVASAGYGKTSLAHDIAWKLWESQAAAGVVLVDTRKVYTKREVDGAFCTALQLDQDASDSTPKILARLRAMVSDAASVAPHGPAPRAVLLVVVDNAEDPIGGAGCAHFMGLLDQIQASVPEARVLVTSREAVPDGGVGGLKVQHYILPELHQADAEEVVRRCVDGRISAGEVAEVARVSGGVPLVLRLVADALKSGRMVMEDVRSAVAAADVAMDLNVLLTALPKGQQTAIAQLSVFPTIFSEKGAAAAMLCDAPKAKALLAVLLKHGLVRYSSSEGVYSLHPRVQQAASAWAVNLQATREACALHCIENLSSWTQLYSSGEASAQALRQARQHQADIAMLLSLLGDAEGPARVAEALAVAATPAAFGRFLYPLGVMPEMVEAWRNIAHHLKLKGDERLYASAISMLAWSLRTANYHSTDGHAESENLFREAVEIRTRLLGKEHVETATALSALGSSLQMQGRSAEAEPLFREVLELRKNLKGADVTEAMANLAWSLQGLKRLPEAEQLQAEVLALREEALGPEHPDTLTALRALAGCILEQGRAGEAEPLLRKAVELRGEVLGPLHPDTLVVMGLLAKCMADQGVYDKAAELYGSAASGWARTMGSEHVQVQKGKAAQAACLEKLGSGSGGASEV